MASPSSRQRLSQRKTIFRAASPKMVFLSLESIARLNAPPRPPLSFRTKQADSFSSAFAPANASASAAGPPPHRSRSLWALKSLFSFLLFSWISQPPAVAFGWKPPHLTHFLPPRSLKLRFLASSASLHNSAIVVFLPFLPLAFHRFRQESPSIHARPNNPSKCTLTNHPASVDSKQLTTSLNRSKSTPMKNIGEGVLWLTRFPNEGIGPVHPEP